MWNYIVDSISVVTFYFLLTHVQYTTGKNAKMRCTYLMPVLKYYYQCEILLFKFFSPFLRI